MKTVLVIGLGEVGMSLYEIIKESNKYKLYGLDPIYNFNQNIPEQIDIMHICFQYKQHDEFISNVVNYIVKYNPKLVIINSTVKPTTTKIISKLVKCEVAFSPVFATHKDREFFKQEIKYYGKFVGGITNKATELTVKHFNNVGINTKITKGALEAEILKLYCTTYFGIMIATAQEFHRLSFELGADFTDITKGLSYLHTKSGSKPPVYPAVIGGHCVLPNINIFLSCRDSELFNALLKSNEKCKDEIKNSVIQVEIEQTKKFLDNYWRDYFDKNREKL